MEITCGGHMVRQEGDLVQPAFKQPLTREKVESSMHKTGNTPFVFSELVIEMDPDIFLPVQALNQLRRAALERLEESLTADFRRRHKETDERAGEGRKIEEGQHRGNNAGLHMNFAVSIEDRNQLDEVLSRAFVDDIYFDSSCYTRDELFFRLKEAVEAVHRAGKRAYYILPAVFRSRTSEFYQAHLEEFYRLGLDGVVVKSYDAAAFAKKQLADRMAVILDHSLYIWNQEAKEQFRALKPLRDTAPLELNRRELFERDNLGSEMIIYGRLPLMTSAQCVHANTGNCDKHKTVVYLKDRYGKFFPVKNNCPECYNTIYNTTPLMLFGARGELERMGMTGCRISFTLEDKEQVRRILDICEETFLTGSKDIKEVFDKEYTNGHYKRGVE